MNGFGRGHNGSVATVGERVKTSDSASNHGGRITAYWSSSDHHLCSETGGNAHVVVQLVLCLSPDLNVHLSTREPFVSNRSRCAKCATIPQSSKSSQLCQPSQSSDPDRQQAPILPHFVAVKPQVPALELVASEGWWRLQSSLVTCRHHRLSKQDGKVPSSQTRLFHCGLWMHLWSGSGKPFSRSPRY